MVIALNAEYVDLRHGWRKYGGGCIAISWAIPRETLWFFRDEVSTGERFTFILCRWVFALFCMMSATIAAINHRCCAVKVELGLGIYLYL